MPIKVVYRGEEIEVPRERISAGELLAFLGLSHLSSIVIKNGEVVSEKEILEEGDNIRIVNAISGGAEGP